MYPDIRFTLYIDDDTTPYPPGFYSHESVLRGAADMLRESAKQHRQRGDLGHARMCETHASMLEETPDES